MEKTSVKLKFSCRNAPNRKNALLSAIALWLCQIVCSLDNSQLSRVVQYVHMLGHSIQSRVAPSWVQLCDEKNYTWCGENSSRLAGIWGSFFFRYIFLLSRVIYDRVIFKVFGESQSLRRLGYFLQ